jgi:putative ABC transport system ATP-binding protein
MNDSEQPFVSVEGVTKTFPTKGEDVTPLEGLDLVVPRGQFLALMGPSGSGKSTLLHLMAGIDAPTRGRVVVGGVDISRLGARALARWRNRHVGFVFQQYNLVPVLTAEENVELPLLLTRDSRAERGRKGSPIAPGTSRASSREASSNEWPSHGRSSPAPSSSSPTSRRGTSTRSPRPRSWPCSVSSIDASGRRS